MSEHEYDMVKMLQEAAEHSVWPAPKLKEKTLFWIAAKEIERLRILVDELKLEIKDQRG